MEFELPAQKSQGTIELTTIELTEPLKLRTGRIAGAIGITVCVATVIVALCVGAFRLGVETASAGIYERQVQKSEALNSGLMRLVGIVDQAKAKEFSSCVQAGAAGCESIIAPVVTP